MSLDSTAPPGEASTTPEPQQQLLSRMIEVAEAERTALAADLHDGPIQHLTAAALTLDLLTSRLTRGGGNEDAIFLAEEARKQLSEEIAGLRQLMTDLRPPTLEERGIESAVRDALDLILSDSPVALSLDFQAGDAQLIPEVEAAVIRIVREAARNVRNDTTATAVAVSIESHEGTLVLSLSDNGTSSHGLRAPHSPLGITMRERAESVGGTLSLASESGRGMAIVAAFPTLPPSGTGHDRPAVRSLTHPSRMSYIDLLRSRGPMTTEELAAQTGDSISAASSHLRQLARYGFIQEVPDGTRGRLWRFRDRAVMLERDAESDEHVVLMQLMDREAQALARFLRGDSRTPEWDAAAFYRSLALRLTPAELEGLARRSEALLDAYPRADADPSGAGQSVRILMLGFPAEPD